MKRLQCSQNICLTFLDFMQNACSWSWLEENSHCIWNHIGHEPVTIVILDSERPRVHLLDMLPISHEQKSIVTIMTRDYERPRGWITSTSQSWWEIVSSPECLSWQSLAHDGYVMIVMACITIVILARDRVLLSLNMHSLRLCLH